MLQKINLGTTPGDKTGTKARPAGQIINDNFEYLETKIDNLNQILVDAGYALAGNVLTINAGWQWKINGVDYTNPVAIVFTIPFAATGKKRRDVVVMNTSNTFSKYVGAEVTGVAVTVTPVAVAQTITLEIFNVSDVNVYNSKSAAPFLGSITPASVPTGSGAAYWHATQAGPYPNHGGFTVGANSFAVFSRNAAGGFSISQTALDLTSYAKAVDLAKKADLVIGKNLYNKATNTLGFYVSQTNGNLISNAATQTSDFIKIVGGTLYQITRATFFAFYDLNKTFISGFATDPITSFTTPSTAMYVRFADTNALMTTGQMLEVGSVKTAFEEYKLVIDEFNLPSNIPVAKVVGVSALIDSNITAQGIVKPVVGKNLYNKATNSLGFYVSNSNGNLISNAGSQTSDFIKIQASTLYQITRATFFAFYDLNKTFISGFATASTGSFTTPSTAMYVRFSDTIAIMTTGQQLEVGSVKTTFEEYQVKFDPSYIPVVSPVLITKTVKRFGTVGVDCDYTGRRGIQDAIDAITDASISKQYIIKASGIFEATQASHFDKGSGSSLAFILLKPYVHLIGSNADDCIITGFLPNNLGVGFQYSSYQTIRHDINNSKIENVSLIGENLRYPLHIDGGRLGCKDFIQTIKTCKIWHKGNTGDALAQWTSTTPFGVGTSDGQEIVLEDCDIKGKTFAAYMHNNQSFSLPSTIKHLRGSVKTTIGYNEQIIRVQSLGSGVRDKFIFDNCVLDDGCIRYDNSPWIPEELINQRADHADTELVMTSYDPIVFDNSGMTGSGLRIKSKSTGALSTVSFEQNSSAFPLIIGNQNESTIITNRYNRNQIYGYQYKSGSQGLSGFAIGTLDIGQYLVGIGSNKYIGALGKRLGDCSVTNKTLTVVIDGVSYNIVFNKNYNGTANTVAPAYSNTQIIAEIVAVIGSIATVDEYVVGKDYYPQFNNVKNMTNADITEVLAGMGVVFTSTKNFRKALNSDNKIDGICLDEGRVGDECRIITRGELYSAFANQRFCIIEVSSSARLIGTQLGISTTVPGKFDVTATPKLLIAKRDNVITFIK